MAAPEPCQAIELPSSKTHSKWVSLRRATRLATAVGKYWITKRAVAVVAEALECLGGNGYVEESPLPRLYRDAPLNSIWEGSGNVQCLEMLRAVKKDAGTLEMVLQEIRAARRGNKHCSFDSRC